MPSVGAKLSPAAHILVVDDDADLRRSLVEVLEDEGFAVSCARNGEEALRALEGEPPSAILLDLAMPVMDGWTFRARQRNDERLAHIPTVVISASFSDARSMSTLEADAFLSKPFDVSRLTETLRRICGAPDAPPAPARARAAARRPSRDKRAAATRTRR
jgi:CheY-like chemotaxis protein